MPKIVKLKKGEAPTLLHAEFANENVMVPLGALRNLTFSPVDAGELLIKGEKAVLKLNGVLGTPLPDCIVFSNGSFFTGAVLFQKTPEELP